MDEVLITNWRRLTYRRTGNPRGFPVFLLHGTPGCRLSARPADADLLRLGVDLIAYDRPGYGRSDPHPGRSVADAADDVRALADRLGFGRFAVMGRSGGGPHALACAALMPDRVTRVASLVGPAPYDAPGLDWLAGMVDLNRRQFGAAMRGPRQLARVIYPQVVAMRADPEHLVRRLESEAAPGDCRTFSDPSYRAELVASMTEAVGRSLDGWASDNLAFTRPWGFDPRWITVPTLLWHGMWDVFIPVAHARWLAGQIDGSVLMLAEGGSHMSAAEVQRGVLRWLVAGDVLDLAG